jgi:hypothetical protein
MGEQLLMDLINSLYAVNKGVMRKRGTGIRPPIEFSNKLFLIGEKREDFRNIRFSRIQFSLIISTRETAKKTHILL